MFNRTKALKLVAKMPNIIETGTQFLNKWIAIIAEVALAIMMLITVGDVVGRYFFNKPIKGTYEIVGLLLVCASTLGWGYCQMMKRHINISFLTDLFPVKAQAILTILAYLIGLVGFSVISWQVFLLAESYLVLPTGDTTLTLGIPLAPFMFILSISAGLMSLTLLIDLIHSIMEVNNR
jgi:TRAP-type transport system small permease protein